MRKGIILAFFIGFSELLAAQSTTRLMPDPAIAVSDLESAIESYMVHTGNRQLYRQLEHPKGMLEVRVLYQILQLEPGSSLMSY